MKNFIYFFKHKNVNAVKIGKTTGESVIERFRQFKTYSPFGSEILGYFECDNCHKKETEIHSLFKEFRLQGEWFNITDEQANYVINKNNSSKDEVNKLLIEYLADENNNIVSLAALLKKSFEKESEPTISELQHKVYKLLPDRFSLSHGIELARQNGLNHFSMFLRRQGKSMFKKVGRGLYEKITS